MKKMFLLVLLTLSLAACVGTTPRINLDDAHARIYATAKRANVLTGQLLANAGPLVVAGICVAQPQDCLPAQKALGLAQGTHNQIAALIAAADAADAAPDGAKLTALTASFASQMDSVNKLVSAYGGRPLDLTEFRATAAELRTAATATP